MVFFWKRLGKILIWKKFSETWSPTLKLRGSLPITTCECERSFSFLKSTKTWDKSTKENGRLNKLGLLFIHRGIDWTVSEIIYSFSRKSSWNNIYASTVNVIATSYNRLTSAIYVACQTMPNSSGILLINYLVMLTFLFWLSISW